MANELALDVSKITPDVEMTLGEIKINNTKEIAEFLKGAEKYQGLIINDEDDRKHVYKLRADLNRMVKVIDDHRKNIKKEMTKPIANFEKEMNELTDIVKETHGELDKTYKQYDQKLKDDKQKEIDELIKEYGAGYEIEEEPSWLNKGTPLDEIKDSILFEVENKKQEAQQREQEIETINQSAKKQSLTPDGYIQLLRAGEPVLNIINMINDAGEKKRKQDEYNAEIERQKAEQVAKPHEVETPEPVAPEPTPIEPEPDETGEILEYTLKVKGTKTQLNLLIQKMIELGVRVEEV